MRKQKIFNVVVSVLIFYGLFYVVSDFWKLLEMIIYKKMTSNIVDMVISFLFAFSLFCNLSNIFRKKAK